MRLEWSGVCASTGWSEVGIPFKGGGGSVRAGHVLISRSASRAQPLIEGRKARSAYKHNDPYRIASNLAETMATGLIWGGQCRGRECAPGLGKVQGPRFGSYFLSANFARGKSMGAAGQ